MGRDNRRTRLVLTLLLLTAITLLLLDGRAGGSSSPLGGARSATGAVFGPVERAVARVVRGPRQFVVGVSELGGRDAELRRLRTENEQLRQDRALDEAQRRRLAEWETLARSSTLSRFPVTPARVIALSSVQGFSTTATLDVGSADGVRVDTTVIGPGSGGSGLVGRVVSVQSHVSTVLLATDPLCYVGIRKATGGLWGGVAGTGAGRSLELTGSQPNPVKVGEVVLSAGSPGDAPFVKDVLVGTVTTVRTAAGTSTTRATVRPAVDFTRLDLVGVVVPPRRPAARGVLPSATPR